jgi:hypothetical protein
MIGSNHSNPNWLAMLLLATILTSCGNLQAEDSKKSSDDLAAEFKDKIVMLEVNRSSAIEAKTGTVVLVKMRITKLGNRDFVVGTGYAPDDDDSWYKDVVVGVPCESIVRFHAMTQKQFADYMKKWKDRSEK